jgi:hypothetical protein
LRSETRKVKPLPVAKWRTLSALAVRLWIMNICQPSRARLGWLVTSLASNFPRAFASPSRPQLELFQMLHTNHWHPCGKPNPSKSSTDTVYRKCDGARRATRRDASLPCSHYGAATQMGLEAKSRCLIQTGPLPKMRLPFLLAGFTVFCRTCASGKEPTFSSPRKPVVNLELGEWRSLDEDRARSPRQRRRPRLVEVNPLREWLVWPQHEATLEYWITYLLAAVITGTIAFFVLPMALSRYRRPAQEGETSWPHAATPTASRHVAKAAARSSRFELAEMRWRQVLNVL